MQKKWIGSTAALFSIVAVAHALPTMGTVFNSTYKVEKGSALDGTKCSVCHVGKGVKLNPYGEDLKKALPAAKPKKMTPETLKKVEPLDSDKDGKTNIQEIKAGTLPGDPKK